MPITELALLRLLHPPLSPTVKQILLQAKNAMQNFTGHTFYYLQQVEDPTCIYVLGEWESLEQHYGEFIPSDENQGILGKLEGEVGVQWLMHLDVPLETVAKGDHVISVGRHVIKNGQRERFAQCFAANKKYLEYFVTEGSIAGGWKVDENREAEEFVLFAPWENVDQHMAFAKTDGFGEYAKIREFVAEAHIKHVKVLEI